MGESFSIYREQSNFTWASRLVYMGYKPIIHGRSRLVYIGNKAIIHGRSRLVYIGNKAILHGRVV